MILYMVVFLGALFLSVPIVHCILGSSIVYVMFSDIDLIVIPQKLFAGINSFVFLAIPFFVLVGQLMSYTGITERLVKFSSCLVGNIRGGLAHVNIVTSFIMGGIQGSAVAECAAIGSVLIPTMVKHGYRPSFAAAVTSTASALGPIVPPSILMIIYGSLAGVSIGRCFLAGAIPGVLLAVVLMITAYRVARKEGIGGTGEKVTTKIFLDAFKNSVFALLVPLIIIGGIVGGVFTATESGAVALFYLLAVSMFRLGALRVSFRNIIRAIRETLEIIGAVLLIVGAANLFGWVLNLAQAGEGITSMLLSITGNRWVILLLIDALILILGCFLDSAVILTVLTGLLAPLLRSLGIDLVHFAVLFTLNLTIGLNTPPVGLSMFVAIGIAGISMEEWLKDAWVFMLAMTLVLVILTFLPQISLFLPNLIMPQ